MFYQGYRIGQVGGITPERTADGTRYKVDLAIRRDWPIPEGQSRASAIDRSPCRCFGRHQRRHQHECLPPGGELKGIEGADIFAAMNELAGQISELTRNQITPLIRTLSQRVDSITGAIDKTTPRILEQTRVLLDRLNVASDSTQRRAQARKPRRGWQDPRRSQQAQHRIAQDARDARSGARRDRRDREGKPAGLCAVRCRIFPACSRRCPRAWT